MCREMNEGRSYAAKAEIGDVMTGEKVGEVVESKTQKIKAGATVVGRVGWQQYALSDGSNLREVDPSLKPLSAYLGVVGMPGVTAWIGLLDIGQPKPRDTGVVSAAPGAAGRVAGPVAQ